MVKKEKKPVTKQPTATEPTGEHLVPIPKNALMLPFLILPNEVPANCPPGLEYLAALDGVFIRQCLEPMEIFTGFHMENAYQIMTNGFMIYWAQEHSDFCTRSCYGSARPFDMTITNQFGIEVLRMHRPLTCCFSEIFVSLPNGDVIGHVENFGYCSPDFLLTDQNGNGFLRITGPCEMCLCGTVEFEVKTMQGEVVGMVTKHWAGWMQEMFTRADIFSITFPVNLVVQQKAVILGACFLIDFVYFERDRKKN